MLALTPVRWSEVGQEDLRRHATQLHKADSEFYACYRLEAPKLEGFGWALWIDGVGTEIRWGRRRAIVAGEPQMAVMEWMEGLEL